MLKYLLSNTLFLTSMLTFAEEFVAGKDYIVIKESENSSKANQPIVVSEFFSYGCPWCYRLDPAIDQWVKQQGSHISFSKVPVVFNKDWEYYAKAFYTAKALTKEQQLTPVLFKTILTDKRPLNSTQAMIDFFVSQGVDATTAQSAFEHSPSIDINVNDAKRQMAFYQIGAVPALVINEQFKTDLQMAKNETRLIAILNFLITQTNKPKAA